MCTTCYYNYTIMHAMMLLSTHNILLLQTCKMNSKTFVNVVFVLVWIQVQSLWTIDQAQGSPLGLLTEVEEIC